MNRDEPTSGMESAEAPADRRPGNAWHYGSKGLEYDPANSETSLWLGLRFQTRFDTYPGDLTSANDLKGESANEIKLRRARIKGGGSLFADWLQIYSEYDFPSDTLLDYRVTATWQGWLSFRAGQWKSEFSRERIDSSGKQQFVERSISNYWFTVDRQRGVAAAARLARGTRADTRVHLEYLTGRGLGKSYESGRGLWLGRLQWNPSGTQLPFSQAALNRYEKPVPSVAFVVVSGRSAHTRFSSNGGGDLPGLQPGDFDLRQYLFETALHYRGFGWQQEFHFKRVTDRNTGARRELMGGYAQLGSFVSEWWPEVPPQLELVGRFAAVDPDRDQASDIQHEWTIGLNWFIRGHRNKITADYSWLDFDDPTQGTSRGRFRLQWELSL